MAGTQVAVEADVRVSTEALRQYAVEALTKAGLPDDGAAAVAEVQLEAQLRGQPTHNVGAIPGYAKRITEGHLNRRPQMKALRETMVHVQLDGDEAPGQWVSVEATRRAIAKAKQSGVGVVGVVRSNHFGAAGHYAWMCAEAGVIGLCTTNGGLVLAPWGGVTPMFGNNPLGIGVPAGRHYPIVLDIAMSVVAQGKTALAIAEGKPIPLGWLMDKRGRMTTNPADFREGLGVPIAEHKGYGLAMIMEILSGALTGAGFCLDHKYAEGRGQGKPPESGHFFLAINPEMFMPIADFRAQIDRMIDQIKSSDLAEGSRGILIAGEIEMRNRAANIAAGSCPVLPSTYRALTNYAKEASLKTPLDPIRG
ncbi:MAG: Ldh family oxidoreductase [Chloroflexota bacterium]|nr:MAG: Ldh family oxidoreductase [Chloroflexota bacterium]